MSGVADGAGAREEDPADEDGRYGGDKLWRFCGGGLTVRAFEDFMEAAIGGVVTKASVDLARWCAERCPQDAWGGRRCVELGAGCGLVSGALLRRGARVLATDMEPLLEHLRWNLGLNAEDGSPEHGVEALSWEDDAGRQALRARLGPGGAGAVLAANCVYSHDAISPFLATVEALSGRETLALMCGIPVPPALGCGGAAGAGTAGTEPGAAAEEATLIDGFLAAAPGSFDAHLVEVPAGDDQARQDQLSYPEGVASQLARAHGFSAAGLANGIWLLKLPGEPPPPWLRPLLTVPASGGARGAV